MIDDVYFISDIHLGMKSEQTDRDKLEKLFSFLTHINHENNVLYIVGDLFDYWFEYKYVVLKNHFKLFYKLYELIENNVKIHFLPGNHDYWTRSFLTEQVGIEVHEEDVQVELHHRLCYIYHGDGIAKWDRGYRLLKRIIRHPLNIFLYKLIHPDLGATIAEFASRTSREYTSQKRNAASEREECLKFAETYHQQGFDCVILGHTHFPFIYENQGKFVVNLGDWINHFTYAKLSQGSLSLETWNI